MINLTDTVKTGVGIVIGTSLAIAGASAIARQLNRFGEEPRRKKVKKTGIASVFDKQHRKEEKKDRMPSLFHEYPKSKKKVTFTSFL